MKYVSIIIGIRAISVKLNLCKFKLAYLVVEIHYTKATHTAQYLQFASHHSPERCDQTLWFRCDVITWE